METEDGNVDRDGRLPTVPDGDGDGDDFNPTSPSPDESSHLKRDVVERSSPLHEPSKAPGESGDVAFDSTPMLPPGIKPRGPPDLQSIIQSIVDNSLRLGDIETARAIQTQVFSREDGPAALRMWCRKKGKHAGQTILHEFAQRAFSATITCLLMGAGCDCNAQRPSDLCTPLHLSIWHAHGALASMGGNSKAAVEALLAGGADPSIKNGFGESASQLDGATAAALKASTSTWSPQQSLRQLTEAGYAYDEDSGYFYNSIAQMYFDPARGYYYDVNNQLYYCFNVSIGQYMPVHEFDEHGSPIFPDDEYSMGTAPVEEDGGPSSVEERLDDHPPPDMHTADEFNAQSNVHVDAPKAPGALSLTLSSSTKRRISSDMEKWGTKAEELRSEMEETRAQRRLHRRANAAASRAAKSRRLKKRCGGGSSMSRSCKVQKVEEVPSDGHSSVSSHHPKGQGWQPLSHKDDGGSVGGAMVLYAQPRPSLSAALLGVEMEHSRKKESLKTSSISGGVQLKAPNGSSSRTMDVDVPQDGPCDDEDGSGKCSNHSPPLGVNDTRAHLHAPAATTDVATRMMISMGWRQGQGLGKNADGPTAIIQLPNHNDRTGLGADTSVRWGPPRPRRNQ